MVDKFGVECARQRREGACRADVGATRTRIPRGVVVRQQEAMRTQPQGRLENRAVAPADPVAPAAVQHNIPQGMAALVDIDSDEHLVAQAPQAPRERGRKGPAQRSDAGELVPQVCQAESSPLRRIRTMCPTVPASNATIAKNVGPSRIRA